MKLPIKIPIQDIIKKHRFNLPAGIEPDYASWERIQQGVGYSLSQARTRLKNLVRNNVLILLPQDNASMLFVIL